MPRHAAVLVVASSRTRLSKARPAALQPLMFRPMIEYVLELAAAAAEGPLWVVGDAAPEVRAALPGRKGVSFSSDPAEALAALGEGKLPVLAIPAESPISALDALETLLETHASSGSECTIGGAPSHPGGVFCWSRAALERALRGYPTETLCSRLLSPNGTPPLMVPLRDAWAGRRIDTNAALAEAEAEMRDRINRRLMADGVSLQDPKTTWVDPRCRFGPDVRIEAGVTLIASYVGAGASIESGSRVVRSVVGDGARVLQGSYIEASFVGEGAEIGPYAHLRPDSRVGAKAKVGNFVELKNAVVGPGSKASHLSYIGDAEIGRDVNIGCGFITCNYDGGPKKHRTVIGDGAFIGSDCQAVAPVRIGAGSLIAAGTTVTEDVPDDALALARTPQANKPGVAKKLRARRGAKAKR